MNLTEILYKPVLFPCITMNKIRWSGGRGQERDGGGAGGGGEGGAHLPQAQPHLHPGKGWSPERAYRYCSAILDLHESGTIGQALKRASTAIGFFILFFILNI
jgi:hypothetical protein